MKQAFAAILVLNLAVLAGCGQKGPLQLPGQPKNAPWPPPAQAQPAQEAMPRPPDLPASSDNKK
jgi:predicted small lipoprotein YifL